MRSSSIQRDERDAPRSAQEPPQLETIDVACTFNRRLCMYRLLAIFHPSRFGLMRVRFQQPQAEAQQVLMVGTSIHSSDPAYPAYLFSYWADWAQDHYKRPLSRAAPAVQANLQNASVQCNRQLPEDIHGIAAVPGSVQQLRREATYKSL